MSDKFTAKVTKSGAAMIVNSIQTGVPLKFSKAVGSQTAYADTQLTDLTTTNYNAATHDQTGSVNSIKANDAQTIMCEVLLSGSAVRTDYTLNTIFLLCGDDLFGVIKANSPQTMNASTTSSSADLQVNVSFTITGADATNLSVELTQPATATKSDFDSLKSTVASQMQATSVATSESLGAVQTAVNASLTAANNGLYAETVRAKAAESSLSQSLSQTNFSLSMTAKNLGVTSQALSSEVSRAQSTESSLASLAHIGGNVITTPMPLNNTDKGIWNNVSAIALQSKWASAWGTPYYWFNGSKMSAKQPIQVAAGEKYEISFFSHTGAITVKGSTDTTSDDGAFFTATAPREDEMKPKYLVVEMQKSGAMYLTFTGYFGISNIQMHKLQNATTTSLANLSQAISSENTRAMGVEKNLSQSLSAEIGRAQGFETSLSQAITSEATRAQSTENSLASMAHIGGNLIQNPTPRFVGDMEGWSGADKSDMEAWYFNDTLIATKPSKVYSGETYEVSWDLGSYMTISGINEVGKTIFDSQSVSLEESITFKAKITGKLYLRFEARYKTSSPALLGGIQLHRLSDTLVNTSASLSQVSSQASSMATSIDSLAAATKQNATDVLTTYPTASVRPAGTSANELRVPNTYVVLDGSFSDAPGWGGITIHRQLLKVRGYWPAIIQIFYTFWSGSDGVWHCTKHTRIWKEYNWSDYTTQGNVDG